MILTAEELQSLRGRELLELIRRALVDEDHRIRGSQEALVAEGLRNCPDPGQLGRADRFHAADRMLEHAIAKGPGTTVKELTEVAREALRGAATRRVNGEAASPDQPGGADTADQVHGE